MARFQRAPNFITPPIKIQQNTLYNFHFDLRYDPTLPSSRRPAHLVLMLTLRLFTTWFIFPATWVTAANPVKSLNAPSCTVADAF